MTMVMTFEAFQRWPRLATVKSRTLLTSSVSKIKSHLWGTKTNRDSHSIHTILNQLHQDAFPQSYILAVLKDKYNISKRC